MSPGRSRRGLLGCSEGRFQCVVIVLGCSLGLKVQAKILLVCQAEFRLPGETLEVFKIFRSQRVFSILESMITNPQLPAAPQCEALPFCCVLQKRAKPSAKISGQWLMLFEA